MGESFRKPRAGRRCLWVLTFDFELRTNECLWILAYFSSCLKVKCQGNEKGMGFTAKWRKREVQLRERAN